MVLLGLIWICLAVNHWRLGTHEKLTDEEVNELWAAVVGLEDKVRKAEAALAALAAIVLEDTFDHDLR